MKNRDKYICWFWPTFNFDVSINPHDLFIKTINFKSSKKQTCQQHFDLGTNKETVTLK